jgi:DnaJ-class molecular chaperone
MLCCLQVRREYKKLALKYHPDKATSSMLPPALALCKGFALVAHDSDLSAWEARVRNEAEWVFKCIGEAHTILSDPVKRSSLDIKLDNMASQARGRADATARPSSQAGRAHHGGGRANQYPSNWQHSHRATGRGGYRPQGSYGHYGKPPSYGFEWSDEDDDDFYSYSNY